MRETYTVSVWPFVADQIRDAAKNHNMTQGEVILEAMKLWLEKNGEKPTNKKDEK